MTKATFAALTDLTYAFPRQDVGDETVRVYMKHLTTYPEPAVVAACQLAVRTCTFFPSVREIIDLMDKTSAGIDAVPEVAWAEVLREVRRVGHQPNCIFHKGEFHDPPKPVFSSSLIVETVESIGWRLICTSDEPEEIRKQFIFSFKAMRNRRTERVQRGNFGTSDPALPNAPELKEVS